MTSTKFESELLERANTTTMATDVNASAAEKHVHWQGSACVNLKKIHSLPSTHLIKSKSVLTHAQRVVTIAKHGT